MYRYLKTFKWLIFFIHSSFFTNYENVQHHFHPISSSSFRGIPNRAVTHLPSVWTRVRNNLLRVVGRYWNTEHNRYVFYYIVAYFHLRDVILWCHFCCILCQGRIYVPAYAKQSVSIHVCVIHAWRVIQFNIMYIWWL